MFGAIALGVAQGARHSLEPDHLAAVSVLIHESRSARRSTWLGAIWGLGHTLTLLAMSISLVAIDAALPASLDRAFTFVVAGVLIMLGLRSIQIQIHDHEHDHDHDHEPPVRRVRTPTQALCIGMLHGLAGTSALTAAVFAASPTAREQLIYISLFGLGSIAGMAGVSGCAGLWLARILQKWLLRALGIAIGVLSIVVGVHAALTAAGVL